MGSKTAIGHDRGSGAIATGEPVVVDLWPLDPESGCFADMTRTFVVGEPGKALRAWHRLCVDALERAVQAVRPGVRGRTLHELVCELFHEHGHPTQLSKRPGQVLRDGFFHALGHGIASSRTRPRTSAARRPMSSSAATCSRSRPASTAMTSGAAESKTWCGSARTAPSS
jgi:Xaa-Pro aminopeptidase